MFIDPSTYEQLFFVVLFFSFMFLCLFCYALISIIALNSHIKELVDLYKIKNGLFLDENDGIKGEKEDENSISN